jgi:surface antigen
MKPVLLMFAPQSIKRYVYFALATLVIILCLPIMAVFALGTSALSFLSSSPSDTTGNSAILTQTVGLYEGPQVPGDYYDWGNCTYWVFYLRLEAGEPIPTSWGNAETWAYYAAQQGYLVDHTPTAGAIMQLSGVDNDLGHVAYVASVDQSNGNWTISEMNVQGLDIVDTKTYPASAAANYNFIHDKPDTAPLKIGQLTL